jgi:ATP-dependent exoDNAse (exonuclease V) beta subunit
VLPDQPARDRIRKDFDQTLVVEAAAGTGKTTETIGRILGLLSSGRARLETIACVTFTEKAAGEMKLRLRTALERSKKAHASDRVVHARLDQALVELERARIGTIHGFCADILRERPVEARVDPLFEVAADDQAQALFGECFDRWFQESLESPDEGLRRVLRRRNRDRGAEGPRGMLEGAGFKLTDARDFPTPWRRENFDRKALMDEVVSRLERLGANAVGIESVEPKDYLVENLKEIANRVAEIRRVEQVQNTRDYDGLEQELKAIMRLKSWNWKGSRSKQLANGVERAPVVAERAAAKEMLDDAVARLDADLAACLHAELGAVVDRYEVKKKRAGRLDFRDLLVKTRDLLRDDLVVREELMGRFTHLLVDEFQDTDPLQAEIMLFLAGAKAESADPYASDPVPGKLFVVGDPKQSIYRFRRADVSLYEKVKAHLVSRGANVLHLSTSFRSAPSIQRAINSAFAPLMLGQRGQASYVALEPFRDEPPNDQPTVVALPVPRPYSDWGKVVGWRIDESLPDAVAAFIDWLTRSSGFTVEERGERVPVAARHVAILFKRLQSFDEDRTRPYVRALETRRIPHALVGGRSFFAREEVNALVAVLSAIEWPDNELSVYATLRGPFVALTDAEILAYKKQHGLRLFHAPKDEDLTPVTRPVAEAMEILRKLHRARNRRPFAETIRRFIEETRAHAALAFWPAGEQALANVLRMLDIARRFERGRPRSFRAFVLFLEEQLDRGTVQDAPVVEETTDGVRMMTVHRAKGLEFPIVILADPTAPEAMREPSRYVDQERGLFATALCGCVPLELHEHRADVLSEDKEEALRLLYVATTRAKDMLVIPTIGDERHSGWLEPLHPIAYPRGGRERASERAPRCPDFGGDSVLERPTRARASPSMSVRPGRHAPEVGDTPVVWWDPHALKLDMTDEVGMRQQKILAADASGVVATESESMHRAWTEARANAVAASGTPTLVTKTVTARRAEELPPQIARVPVEIVSARKSAEDRPRGTRFGTLVHAVLSAASLKANGDELAILTAFEGRMLGATDEEMVAAKRAAAAALAHPLFDAARAAKRVLRETALHLKMPDGSLAEGACDLAFTTADELVVVDYKTDVDVTAKRADYERQIQLYAAALAANLSPAGAASTGPSARGVIFLV